MSLTGPLRALAGTGPALQLVEGTPVALLVGAALGERIALSDALIVAYDRTPPDDVERLDSQLRVSVILRW